MEMVTVLLLAIVLLAIAMVGMAAQILLKKGGKFPNTHVSGNKHLKRNGVFCYQTQDKLAQREALKQVNFKKVALAPDMKAGQ